MRAKLISIGNSRGVRLPKPLIREVGLTDEVEIRVREKRIEISPVTGTRSGWAEAARLLHNRNEDASLDQSASTHFDETEWTW